MAKSKPQPLLEELRRRLVLLDRLRGRPLRCAEGVAIVDIVFTEVDGVGEADADDGRPSPRAPKLLDPQGLYEACARGWPSASTLAATVELVTPPLILRPSLLATMQRDLRALRKQQRLGATLREAPRLFRRFGEIDEAWFSAKRERLGSLTAELRLLGRDAEGPGSGIGSEIDSGLDEHSVFLRVRTLIGALRGEAAMAAIDSACARLRDDSHNRRRLARRRLAALMSGLRQDPTADPGPGSNRARAARKGSPSTSVAGDGRGAVAAALRECREVAKVPGRRRRRLLEHIVGRLLELPPPSERTMRAGDHQPSLASAAEEIGERLIAAIEPSGGAAMMDLARRFFALYGLTFSPLARRGSPPEPLTPTAIRRALRDYTAASSAYKGLDLTIDEVLRLRRLDLDRYERSTAAMVAGGVPIAAVEAIVAADALAEFAKLRSPAAATSYAEWFLTLAPHYAAMGLDVPFSAAHLERLAAPVRSSGRRRDLGVLALCLMAHHREAGAAGASTAVARLDATLALFERRPAEADAVLSELAATSPGAGTATFPEFTIWLCGHLDPTQAAAVEAQVDRFVHLSRLAARPIALSRRLRADFERDAALLRERAHLSSLATLSPDQETRLRRLEGSAVAAADPSRTRRRLAAEIEVLHGEAYEVQVDGVFRRIVKEVWDLSFDRLTPAWRDAIRFYLQTQRNHGLLRVLLRGAAAGADVRRMTTENQAWITAARGRQIDVDAWLAPRHRSLLLDGARFTLAVERDPVEVLRMGVPFDTCLSITGGFNAASTVINAVDANKQVLYLRDRRKRIIARKLVAISEDDELIGYNLYIADRARVREIEGAFAEFCEELAQSVGVLLGSRGEPAQLHEGFWYDDGVEPFVRPSGSLPDVQAYCVALGLPAPKTASETLQREARLFQAIAERDTGRICSALSDVYYDSALREHAVRWLRSNLEPDAQPRQVRDDLLLLTEILLGASFEPRPFLEDVAKDERWQPMRLLSALVPKPGFARLLVEIARDRHDPDERFDDHGFTHQTLSLLPRWIAVEPVAEALALLPLIEPIWGWIAASSEYCVDCVERARAEVESTLTAGYAASPDPAAVLRVIEGRRSSPSLRRLGLRIAATYSLAGDDPHAHLPAPAISRRLARLGKRVPSLLAEPRFSAALIRQSAGDLPHGVRLARPEECDFPGEPLGARVAAPVFSRHLEPWLNAPADDDWSPSSWQPGPWELYLRRRLDPAKPSPLRVELIRLAMRSAPAASPATDWLARLGDLDALNRVRDAPERIEATREGKPKLTRLEARYLAKAVRTELLADALGDLGEFDVEAQKRVYTHLKAFDPGTMIAARQVLDRHLEGEPVGGDALERAVDLLGRPWTVELHDRVDLVQRIVSRPADAVSPPSLRLAGNLVSLYSNLWSTWTPEAVLAIGAHPDLRGPLLRALTLSFDDAFGLGIRMLRESARRVGRSELGEELSRAWRLIAAEQLTSDAASVDDGTFHELVQDLLEAGTRPALVDLYAEITSPARAATFLAILQRSSARADPALHEAIDGQWPSDDGDDDDDDDERNSRMLVPWLRQCVAGELPGSPGLRADSFPSPAEAATLTRP